MPKDCRYWNGQKENDLKKKKGEIVNKFQGGHRFEIQEKSQIIYQVKERLKFEALV